MRSKVLFVQTRPSERATHLPQLASCADVFEMPLLGLQPKELDDDEKHFEQQLLDGNYRLLVVVSITATEYALASLSDEQKQILAALTQVGRLTVVAVGTPTAQALRQHGFVVQTPTIASNEGMIQMPCVQALKAGDKVLFWRGVGGRRLLHDDLVQRGMDVSAIKWYQRAKPDTLLMHAKLLKNRLSQYDQKIMLISSQLAWEHWQQMCHELDIDGTGFAYITMGERLRTLICHQYDTACVLSVVQLSDVALSQAISNFII